VDVALEQVGFGVLMVGLARCPLKSPPKSLPYLTICANHGRGASLPYVRHRIQTSRNFPDMSEIRTDQWVEEDRYLMRVLTCFVDEDSKVLVCFGGNKHRWEQGHEGDWYETYVPVADVIVSNTEEEK